MKRLSVLVSVFILGLLVAVLLGQAVYVQVSGEQILTPQHFGAKGNGADDDTTAIQNWLNATGKQKLWPTGTYLVTSQVSLSKDAIIDCQDVVLDGSGTTGDPGSLDATLAIGKTIGSASTAISQALSTDVAVGDITLTFAAALTANEVVDGDRIVIYNPTADSWMTGVRKGEFARVRSLSGAVITLYDPVYDSYTAAAAKVAKFVPVKVQLRGKLKVIGTIQPTDATLINTFAVRAISVADSSFDGLEAVNAKGAALLLQFCDNLNVTNTRLRGSFSDVASAANKYGIHFGSCQSVYASGQFFSEVSHASTTGQSTGTIGADTVGLVCRNIVVDGEIVAGNSTAADWHAGTEYCGYRGTIRGGVAAAGDRNWVKGTIHASKETSFTGVCIVLRESADQARGWNFDFSGCKLYSPYTNSTEAVVSWGKDGSSPGASTNRGGTLNLSQCTIIAPNMTNANGLIHVINRASAPGAAEPIIVDLSGVTVQKSSSSITNLVRVFNSSGDDISFVNIDGFTADRDKPIELEFASVANVLGSTLGTASPAQIAADQTAYNPSAARIWRLNSDVARTIHGMAGKWPNRLVTLVNVGSANIVLANQSATDTTASNRIITGTGADVTLAADDTAELYYDVTTLRWRIVNTH